MKILYLPLEFQEWSKARHLTYFFSFGFEEGFSANGIEFTTVPALCHDSAGREGSPDQGLWLARIRELCRGRTFDQVWCEVVHSPLDESTLEWISQAAPVRLALVGESLTYERTVTESNPHLADRRRLVEARLRHFTHGLVVDEVDAADLSARGVIKTFWYPSAVPERYLGSQTVDPPGDWASFSGSVYGKRGDLLEDPRFAGVFMRLPSPEAESGLSDRFDALHRDLMRHLREGGRVDWRLAEAYARPLRAIRRESFRLWIRNISRGAVVVNLPSYYQGYAGRVAEGIAAGRPVISWDVPDRPRNRALFEEGEEILLFGADDRETLHEHIQRLLRDPSLRHRIASGSMRRLWRFHTLEKRVAQILDWMESGEEPSFSEAGTADDIVPGLAAFGQALAGADSPTESPMDAEALPNRPTPARLKDLAAKYAAVGDFMAAARNYMQAIQLEGGREIGTWLACTRACLRARDHAMGRLALQGAVSLDPAHPEIRELESAFARMPSASR